MRNRLRHLLLVALSAVAAPACDANVVDAVIAPPVVAKPEPIPDPDPEPPSPLQTSLLHRYDFSGEGARILDTKGAAHGDAVGTTLVGDGTLALTGEHTAEYVDLPNGIVSGLTDLTVEAWLTWQGGAAWQRIFDFGSSSAGEGSAGPTGTSYLFLTTEALDGAMRAAYSENGVEDEDICVASAPFPIGVATHVALVVEPSRQAMRLYQDGQLVNDCFLARPLSLIEDVNNWLGHSNYVADVDLGGSFDEFRIYAAALTSPQIADSFSAGPDAQPLVREGATE